ncbi:MarR family transcriptional regulator [Bradyrhizobium sp. Pear77]|uniref:MarR family winged helix-turn-helix transcriptional regulator n=1 Tax=Bradyrhizobium altum TaxID=1571202 RepID=UPI0035E21DD1|nr:MarR family transcriptional regulator [Bradyrhizobium altum]
MKQGSTLSHDLMDLVAATKRIVRQEFSNEAGPNGPTLTQYRMLHRIRGGVRQVGTLAEAFGISQPAASIMVSKMVRDGFLKRVPHPTDRRQIELHLTAKANSQLESGLGRAFLRLDEKLSVLSKTKRNEVAKHIRELSRLLSQSVAGESHE